MKVKLYSSNYPSLDSNFLPQKTLLLVVFMSCSKLKLLGGNRIDILLIVHVLLIILLFSVTYQVKQFWDFISLSVGVRLTVIKWLEQF